MLDQGQIQQKIEELYDRLETLTDEIRSAGARAAEAEAAYEVSYAQERLRARWEANENGVKLTVAQVEDIATVATSELRLKALLARNDLSTLREAIGLAKTEMDGLRTLAASNRVQV